MKRSGNLFPQVTEFANLLNAAGKAMRGHKHRPAVAHFNFHLETELFRLQEELRSHTYQPQPYHVFTIHEPKKRQICAAPIRDRVVHHAVCNIAGPLWESTLINDTYACRTGKGQHAAVLRAQQFARRDRYFLQCDIAQYFASIDHARLKELLRRKIKDPDLLSLLDRIIDQPLPAALPQKGLPIGNLTSQYFANLYLGELDHYLSERVGVGGYVRYMDDFVVFDSAKEALHETLCAARGFVEQRLALQLKERSLRLAQTHAGLSFLGCRVFAGTVRLPAEKWQRFRRRWRAAEAAYRRGDLDEDAWLRSAHSRVGHLLHANTLALRRKFFEEGSSWR